MAQPPRSLDRSHHAHAQPGRLRATGEWMVVDEAGRVERMCTSRARRQTLNRRQVMPFGLGSGELIFMLLLIAVPIGLLLFVARVIGRAIASGRAGPEVENQRIENRRLSEELQQAQLRIQELEARVGRIGESPAGTPRRRIETPRAGP